jgi:predicted transglutaminase-like cysteine proteinase
VKREGTLTYKDQETVKVEINNNNKKESDKRQRRRRHIRMRTSLMREIRRIQRLMRTTIKTCDDENIRKKED